MTINDPTTELTKQFSSDDAQATPWPEGRKQLEEAEIYWISSVRPDGRPHVTPMLAIWLDGALYFCTGETERKAKNLAQNAHVVITTGCNSAKEGLDIVVEGDAVHLTDVPVFQRLADLYASKYGWHFTVGEGGLYPEDGDSVALVFKITPTTVFGFGKGEPFSQTRWRF